ncbi:MAG: ferrous iron transporter B [Deltaproteobacteria bacterium]|nr:ferrous iron transporter B [Deltaproteobacteria bacterium]MBW2387180.1 ferrous iron transporter B [Deltaproteobacteria bacterium]
MATALRDNDLARDSNESDVVALVGGPNTGKTTLFNALTGARAKVGNYPGVTVERREGQIKGLASPVQLIDLPGTYSLNAETLDERVVEDMLSGEISGERKPDAILLVVDATTLERGLALVLQVLAAHPDSPVAVAVTMIDELRARGGRVNFDLLARRLGVSIFPIVGNRGVGMDVLLAALAAPSRWSRGGAIAPVESVEARFAQVDTLWADIQQHPLRRDERTDRIDRVLLHPLWGGLIFASVMIFVFQSIFTWAVPAMDGIDGLFSELGRLSRGVLPEGLLTDLWTDGILAGVGSVMIFLPQIIILFTLIHFLEDIGYMARAAFVVDRVMGWFGLQGRSFIVLLSCYACAVPGIMAARTIPNPRDRLATILVAPFMTCSARLPVYTLLIAAFVPAVSLGFGLGLQGLVMLALYLLGAVTAVVSAALLKATVIRGHVSTFYMELPPYRFPSVRLLASQVWRSAKAFLKRAGTIVFVATVIVWALLNFPKAEIDPDATPAAQAQMNLEASLGAQLGKAIEPAIAPLGFDWKIGAGLIASFAAREIIVSTLAQIYAIGDAEDFEGLRGALQADVDPRTGELVFSLPVALSLLVFFVFALQCTSTIAVMARETGGWRWPIFALVYMLALAWSGAFVTYRVSSLFV